MKQIIILIAFVGISEMLYSQHKITQQDSLRAISILQQANINESAAVSLNPNNWKLELTEKEVNRIAKVVLHTTYGRRHIRKQKPFHVINSGRYWVIWGQKKRIGYGGVFEIVINSENACVEYLVHYK